MSHAPAAATANPSGTPKGGIAAKKPTNPPTTIAADTAAGSTRARRHVTPNSAQPKAKRR